MLCSSNTNVFFSSECTTTLSNAFTSVPISGTISQQNNILSDICLSCARLGLLWVKIESQATAKAFLNRGVKLYLYPSVNMSFRLIQNIVVEIR